MAQESATTDLERRLAQALRELSEAREQQTATSEVLQVISSSPGELAAVFQTMLANAVRLCEAKFGFLYLYEGGAFRIVAAHDVPPAFSEARRRTLLHPPPGGPLAEVIRTKQAVQVADLAATPVYAERSPPVVDAVELGGIRTQVTVPLLKDNELIGVIGIFRQEVRPFTDKQVALLTSFASQAVIAIENTRLLNELRESLQQQAATADVLKVISSSPVDTQPVFDAIVRSGLKLFPDAAIMITLADGDEVKAVAVADPDAARAEALRRRFPIPLSREHERGRHSRRQNHRHSGCRECAARDGKRYPKFPGQRLPRGDPHAHAARGRRDRSAQRQPPRARAAHGQADRVVEDLR
jgi:hypothetical protein